MKNHTALLQPLMMRRDYGITKDKKEKEALIEDYDNIKPTEKKVIKDYDSPK
jgi:hypothetical protein